MIAIGFLQVWLRNAKVWRKLFWSSIIGNFGEPLIYLLALGYGLGRLVGSIDGIPYVTFLASGIVCSSTMNTASFEGMYSAFTRMEMQRTWDAILTTPLTIRDVVLGEACWCATKGLISATAIIIVMFGLRMIDHWQAIFALPIAFLLGLCFGAMALIMTSISKSYDFFLFYFTLFITPMLLLSGVFFPMSHMPAGLVMVMKALPLSHAVSMVRSLLLGQLPTDIVSGLLLLVFYTVIALAVAVRMIQRRLVD